MKRKYFSFEVLMLVALASVVIGVLISVGMGRISKTDAVEYYYESPVQATPAVFGKSELPSFAEIAKEVNPAVVNVSTKKNLSHNQREISPFERQRNPFSDDFFEKFFQAPREQSSSSLGSGFIINSSGNILTNNHVVQGADEIVVTLADKRKFDAKIVGTDPKTDIAVIKIKGSGLPYVKMGNSDTLEVGEWVMAVGNPFGYGHSVTAGIVSAKGRIINAGPYDDFIQTDASINPGNSGGPLFNVRGEVVGINTAIVMGGQGVGFAIPINMAKDLVPQLITSGKVTRGWLGVGIQEMTDELAKSFNIKEQKGALVGNVFPGSPAEKAGIKEGDVIIEYDGKAVNDSHHLPAMVAKTPVGKNVILKIVRDGKNKDVAVKISEMEKGMADARTEKDTEELGLLVRDIPPEEGQELGLPRGNAGVYVIKVDMNGPAANAGVQPGDILLKVGDVVINSVDDYVRAVKKVKKGSIVRLFIKRDDSTIFFAFTK